MYTQYHIENKMGLCERKSFNNFLDRNVKITAPGARKEIKAYLLSLQEPSESAAVKENVVPSASESSNSMSDT